VSTVTRLNSVKLQPDRTGTKHGGGASLVPARTPATLSSKKNYPGRVQDYKSLRVAVVIWTPRLTHRPTDREIAFNRL